MEQLLKKIQMHYTTFANGGQFIDAYMIEKIEDLDGNIIYEHESEPVEVFSPETCLYDYRYVTRCIRLWNRCRS